MFFKDFVISIVVFFCGSYLVSQDFRSPIELWTIKNPANAWSSLCYALPVTTLEVKAPLLTLSVASFALWSNENVRINFIDVTCIFWVILIVSAHLLPRKNVLTTIVNISFVCYIIGIICGNYDNAVLNFYHRNIVPITGTILGISATPVAYYYYKQKEFIIGTIIILFGFACKLCTLYLSQYWGTSVFHVSTSIGIVTMLRLDRKMLKQKETDDTFSIMVGNNADIV
jgi:hypothetical protein